MLTTPSRSKSKELVGEFKNAGRERQRTSPRHDPPRCEKAILRYLRYGSQRGLGERATTTPPHSPSPPSADGGRRWESAPTRMQELFIAADAGGSNGYRSRLEALGTEASPTKLVSRSASATSPRARVNGTRLSTACSVTLPRTGGARRCVASRPSSSIRTPEPALAFV